MIMLRSANEIRGYVLQAQDGEIGRSKDFLFDDQSWTIRYMVVDTAKWLPGRKVLISPISLGTPDWATHRFPVKLSRSEVQSAPELSEDAPVSRQYETQYYRHFGWPIYWGGPGAWGAWEYPMPLFDAGEPEAIQETEDADEHLRSIQEVASYGIHATDGDIGSVHDFIVDDRSWSLRYLVVDTRDWLPGRKVLIAIDWIDQIDWLRRNVSVDLTREELKASPEYDPQAPVNREYEQLLYDFYGRPFRGM
jgi:hypothetical protein